MQRKRVALSVIQAAGLAVAVLVLPGCVGENQAAAAAGSQKVGGDDRTGAYDVVADWWKPAPTHDSTWTWGSLYGMAQDTPDRIIVGTGGDRNRAGQRKAPVTNLLVVVDGNGNFVESWPQWDSILQTPHQIYVSPYDPERHIWVVDRGNAQVLKFTNDGKQLAMRIGDPNHPTTQEAARANPDPGDYTYGWPSVLAFLPDGSFYLGDGYWNSRIVKYDKDGKYVMEWGELGSGPGQFNLIHGVGVDRDRRVYVADRGNNRIQVFSETGEFIQEWPDIYDPAGIVIDENDAVWVSSARLNRILKYDTGGHLQYYWGAYGMTAGIWQGGFARPHGISVADDGTIYVAQFDGGWVNKFVPKPGADPSKLIARPLRLTN